MMVPVKLEVGKVVDGAKGKTVWLRNSPLIEQIVKYFSENFIR